MILLVRHGRAGKRTAWDADDSLRPLDDKGLRQALALPELLAEFSIERIVSSPFVRCVETVTPLAARLDLEIERRDELAVGGDAARAWELAERLGGGDMLLCTHAEVIDAMIGSRRKAAKGSVWVIDARTRRPQTYLRP